ncbi:hypothetical protein AUJ68_02005 [Candidatus Woesearchaeota archaeon CG1_02_57_44]|nr:MAG: hypothetical protein AUJ68_02005 [Candidatus Woesearchaeota archaeon CG1_02_57_44]
MARMGWFAKDPAAPKPGTPEARLEALVLNAMVVTAECIFTPRQAVIDYVYDPLYRVFHHGAERHVSPLRYDGSAEKSAGNQDSRHQASRPRY